MIWLREAINAVAWTGSVAGSDVDLGSGSGSVDVRGDRRREEGGDEVGPV